MTLRIWVVILTIFIFGLVLGGEALVFSRGLKSYGSATATSAAETRAEALGDFLARTLYEEWKSVEAAALRIDPSSDRQVLRTAVNFLAGNQEKATWIGIASADGTVVAGTNGAREGTSVSDRTWFQRGLEGPFAGDVHESQALTEIVQPETDEPLRFVDFSAPVYTPEGSVYGVLGVLVNWRWVGAIIGEAARALELDAYLVNRSGEIILGTADYTEETANLAVFRAAALHATATFHEAWPDGKEYFTATFPERRYETLPPFGWSFVVRLDPNFITAAERDFQSQMRIAAFGAFALAIVLMATLFGLLSAPLDRLVDAVLDIAKGVPVPYVREYRRFAEVRKLSEAVVRLQSAEVSKKEAEPAEAEAPVSGPALP